MGSPLYGCWLVSFVEPLGPSFSPMVLFIFLLYDFVLPTPCCVWVGGDIKMGMEEACLCKSHLFLITSVKNNKD